LPLVTGKISFEGIIGAAHLIREALAFVCGAGAVFGIVYTVLAIASIGRFFARPASEPTGFPPVTIVKPLHGHEWALLRNLSSFCQQDYPGPVQFLFGVHDPGDSALETVDELRRLYPGAQITVVSDSRLHGPNRKVSNLVNMLPKAQHDVLVFADSDVAVDPGYLRSVVGELQKPGIGLVTCLYRGQPDPGFWPRLSAMATNYQFLPSVVIGMAFGLARPCFGQTLAMRRETLDKIGGLAQFARLLAEDHAVGMAVRRAGGKVAVPPFAVSHACVETSFTKLVAHELRWSRTIRCIDPLGHLGSALINPFAFAIFALALSGCAAWTLPLAVLALVVRLALQLRTDRALRQPHRDPWLLPLWDLLSFAIFVTSLFGKRVIWRGFSFNVDGDGFLSLVEDQ
jgi:ceramide glucosyltransferase